MSPPARYVLVIESDVALLNRVVHELDEAGFTPRLAATAAEVIADVEGQPFPVCILLCLDAVGADAERILARVKATPSWQQIPVVLIASPTAPEVPGHMAIDGVISKPPAPGAVARIVASFP